MSNENKLIVLDDAIKIGQIVHSSNRFSIKNSDEATVKILAGQELGIGAIASINGLYIYKDKIGIMSAVMASLVKSSPKYDYRVRESTDQLCRIEFFEGSESVGFAEFTIDEAKKAGLLTKDNWKTYPSDMLFARALSRGFRRFTPDLGAGPVYTTEEIEDNKEDFIIEMPETPELIPEKVVSQADQQALNEGRAKWIENIVKQPNFPKDGNPMEKVTFINSFFESKGLEFRPVKPAEIMSMAG